MPYRILSLSIVYLTTLLLLNVSSGGEIPAPREVSQVFLQKTDPVEPPTPISPTLDGPKTGTYLIELRAKSVPKGSAILWDVGYRITTISGVPAYVDSTDVQIRIIKSEQALIFSGPKGFYRVKCRLVKGEDSSEVLWEGELTGGVAPPIPVPPGPAPIPVPVEDDFTKAVKAAYAADPDPSKQTYTLKLASIYRVASTTTVWDLTLLNYRQLTDDMTKASRSLLGETTSGPVHVLKVRAAVADRLDKTIGINLALAIDREKTGKELAAVAEALTAAAK